MKEIGILGLRLSRDGEGGDAGLGSCLVGLETVGRRSCCSRRYCSDRVSMCGFRAGTIGHSIIREVAATRTGRCVQAAAEGAVRWPRDQAVDFGLGSLLGVPQER